MDERAVSTEITANGPRLWETENRSDKDWTWRRWWDKAEYDNKWYYHSSGNMGRSYAIPSSCQRLSLWSDRHGINLVWKWSSTRTWSSNYRSKRGSYMPLVAKCRLSPSLELWLWCTYSQHALCRTAIPCEFPDGADKPIVFSPIRPSRKCQLHSNW